MHYEAQIKKCLERSGIIFANKNILKYPRIRKISNFKFSKFDFVSALSIKVYLLHIFPFILSVNSPFE